MDSQFQSLKEEMHEMRKNYNNRDGNPVSKNYDTLMCESHEANYIQSEGYQNRNSHDSYSHQSLHDPNDSEKSLTYLNNDVKNNLEDFKRCVRSMRTVHSKLYEKDNQSKTNFEKSITKFLDGQRVANIGNGPVSVSIDTNCVINVLPPKTAEEILARERERKARTTLLMALPEDHLAKFHKITDAKEMWEAIKSRFGGNDESKKMQKYILKQQFEGFSVSNSEGLHKGYDRFQSLLSQLEIHGAGVSTEDANQKFLRSLPSVWSQVSLIMRTKPGVDSLSFDDLYNNLRVFESDVKGSTASSSSTQNVAFVSENTSSTNEVSTAYGASNSSGHKPQRKDSSSYTDELMYSFFANPSSGL
ncbi:hypothetical protein Tco_0399619, partial [Tanacetum coccineum]